LKAYPPGRLVQPELVLSWPKYQGKVCLNKISKLMVEKRKEERKRKAQY
jgi:hypothetical protein